MFDSLAPLLGTIAAALTTLSYIPQVKKAWPRGETGDLSLRMLVALTAGLLLWVAYGALRGDWVLAGSNVVGATMVGIVLAFKLRDLRGAR